MSELKSGFDVLALILLYVFFFFKRWKSRGKDVLLVNTLFYIYLGMVFYVTLMPFIISLPHIFDHPYDMMKLIPFEDYFLNRGDAVRQILLNVFMMVPFGFLLPIVRKQGFFSSVFMTFLFSLLIELLQPLINGYRTSDITDLITNTTGGIIGFCFYRVFKSFVNAFLIRINPNRGN